MIQYTNITHTFEPVYDANTKILILGTFPSVKSREIGFYYGHPQNRFWKVLAEETGRALPVTLVDKKQFLLENNIGIWDVIKSCSIKGSDDNSITDVEVNDFSKIFSETKLSVIAANGTKAYELYNRYVFPVTGREIVKLPSTSPANAAWSLERLCKAYGEVIASCLN